MTSAELDHGTLSRLWLAGSGSYGAKWTKYYGELPLDSNGHLTIPGSLWARGLGAFSRQAVLDALERHIASGNAWPPNLPEMRLLCMGIPTFAAVKRDIAAGADTPSPFVRAVWEQLDVWAYKRADSDKSDRLLREAYELALEAVTQGVPLPEPAVAAITEEKPKFQLASDQTVKQSLEEIAAMLRVDPQSDAEDETP